MADVNGIYDEYGRGVYLFLLKLTGDEAMAEELLQETFYRAVKDIGRFEGRCSLMTWLCQIGKNAYFKELRRKRRSEATAELYDGSEETPSTEEQVLRADEIRRIRQSVERLDEPYRTVFVLRVYAEQSFASIGASHGKSEVWARVTFHRAKEKIISEVKK